MRRYVSGLVVVILMALLVVPQAGWAAEGVIFKSRDLSLGGAADYSIDWWLATDMEGGVTMTAQVRKFAFANPYYTGHVHWSKGAYPYWTEALTKGLEMIKDGTKEGPVASWPDDALVISLMTASNGQTYLVHKFKAFPPDKVRPLKLTPQDAEGVIKALNSLP